MVNADPDVPHAFDGIAPKHPPGTAVGHADLSLGTLGAEQGTALIARQIHFQQAPVQVVLRKDQAISQRQAGMGHIRQPQANGRPQRTQVHAVGMLAGLQIGIAQGAALAQGTQGDALPQPGFQLGAARLGLAPSDLAIPVMVEVKNQVDITQVDVGTQAQLPVRRTERKVAVAAGMGHSSRGPAQGHEHQRRAQATPTQEPCAGHHGRPPVQLGCNWSCCISGPSCGSV